MVSLSQRWLFVSGAGGPQPAAQHTGNQALFSGLSRCLNRSSALIQSTPLCFSGGQGLTVALNTVAFQDRFKAGVSSVL